MPSDKGAEDGLVTWRPDSERSVSQAVQFCHPHTIVSGEVFEYQNMGGEISAMQMLFETSSSTREDAERESS
jgi:hypothetical protein